MGESVLAVVDGQSSRFRASAGGRLRKRLPVGFICLLVFSSVLYSDYIPSVRAATSTSWNPKVQCTPLIVRITDITANQTGSGSFSTSPFTPGITTTVAGGLAKRWLTPGPTPPGWVTPGPPCTVTNSRGTTSVFVEIDGIERGSIATEDSAGSYDSTNGGTSHPTTYDTTFNIFDPSFVSSYSSSCSSSTDKTCYGRMHAEIDHDWKAAGYCGSGTICDESALASKTSSSSTKIDIQGFVSWDPGHLTEGWHSFNGWEIHPVTGWRLSGQQDFSLSANPSTVSFNAGTTSSFTVAVSSLNGFTSTVNLSTNVSPSSGLSVGCSPNAISGGSGSSTITVTSQNGFTGTVTLSITTNSTNLACSPSSGSITGGSGTFTLSCSGSVAGNYLSKVTGTSGTLSHATSVTYTITTPTHPDFSITIRPANITTYPGFSGLLSAVDVNTVNGFSGIVTLATTNQVGLSFSLFPSTIEFVNGSPTCGCESELLVATTSATPLGRYTVNVTGTSGSVTHWATMTLIVASSDFALSSEFASQSAPLGGVADTIITVNGVNGFYGSVNLVVASSSKAISCMFITATTTSANVVVNLPFGTASVGLSCKTLGPAGLYNATVVGTSGSLTHSIVFSVTVTDFSISAYAVPLTVGSSSGFVTVKSILGLSGNVSLSLSIPSGLNGSCLSSLLLPSGGTTTVQCNFTSISPGVYSVNVTGSIPCSSCSIGHVSHTTTFSVTINDFSLSIAHSSVTIYPGFSGVLNAVTVSAFNGTVSLSATNLPNVSFTLSPSAITFINGNNLCGCTSEMDVSSTSAAALGTYTINVTGTVGSITHTVSMTLVIASPDFTLTLGGSSQSIPLGGPADTFVYLNGVNGFYGNVNLVVASSSTAIACQFLSGNSANTPLGNNITVSLPFGSATVILSCTAVGPVGVFNATVTGTSGSLIHSAIFTVTIMDYSISATPVSFSAGSSGNGTVTVTSLHGLSGTVSLSVSTPSGLIASCPTSVNLSSGGSSSVQCKFTSTVPGTYSTNVTGTLPCINCSSSGIIVHSALSSVTVSTAKPDFTLSADPETLTIPQGSSATSSVSTTSINGFAGTISLAASVSPVGLSNSFNLGTISLTAGATRGSTLNVTALGAAPGTYNVNVTATSGSLSHSLIIVVTVTSVSMPSYALVVSYEGFVYKLYPNNTLTLIGQPVTTQLRAMAWKPDGSYALIVGDSAVLIKYDGTRLTTIPTGLSTATIFLSVAWGPDGSYALIGTSAGVLLEYDGTSVTRITTPYNQYFRAIAWNPSGTLALIVGYSGQVFLFQSTGQISLLSSGTTVGLDAVAWNPSGAYALISGDGGVILRYDGTTFQALNTAGLYSSTLRVRFISWDPSGSQALLVGDSGLVLRYDGSSLSAMPVLTSSILYSVSWSA